jgi:hypothetical protein
MEICSRCRERMAGVSGLCNNCEQSRDSIVARAHAYIADKPNVRMDELAEALDVPQSELSALINGGIHIRGYDSDRCDCGQPGDPSLNGRCADCHNQQVARFRAAAGLDGGLV